eukprot:CAMPEP_0197519806 /NCGR_PEP_ID=MMETSP1318-20131121/5079_1 /TAXON_ID=552666 /ORGANISM="Partenskyella glossopodia, Strain RCC365" /LENGTH=343 /DNA_ID=CAMNT_0043070993 /DNA_START=320 /DNA_END=1351 /DNA_ORIENTATION=+
MRDSGLHVIVGNQEDSYKKQAVRDGMEAMSISQAASKADILFILTTDESQPEIWEEQVLPHIKTGKTLVWASGYNVAYETVAIPPACDVLLIAPRMMGSVVRDLYVAGRGAMAEVGVHRNASGKAERTMLALCKAIALDKGGCIVSTCMGEAALDLFAEQIYMPVMTQWIQTCFELGVEFGFAPEKMVLELYASSEMSQIFHLMATRGCFKQMAHHSTTSQYGTFSRASRFFTPEIKDHFNKIARKNFHSDIEDGKFVDEWTASKADAQKKLQLLMQEKLTHPMSKAEDTVLSQLSTFNNASTSSSNDATGGLVTFATGAIIGCLATLLAYYARSENGWTRSH